MCFDDQVLSAYYDGELEGSWKDKVRDHLESCSRCSSRIKSFQKTGKLLASVDIPDNPYQKSAVWERVRHSISMEEELGFWAKRVSVMKAVGAVAAVSILVFGASLFMNRKPEVAELPSGFSLSSGEVIRTDEVGNFIRLMNSSEDPQDLLIQLPDNRSFKFLGEPQFLREADFVRSR